MISKEQVKHIAALARLSVKDEELEKISSDLSSILDYVAELNEIDVSDVSPTLTANFEGNVFRNDEEISQDLEVAKRLVESAPDKEDGYIKVKAILK
ncbi:Asp-tRNA(Asn)/Glu-tRNA(Gln) amidotransferase subunit GatC [Candidatus Azambacteria bacterium]|nr:Asp-tRNA(Asn)/Glu-tRNA(Gln) amidotransferase subunit GatC [Candidatus Azambacteria bacterium]